MMRPSSLMQFLLACAVLPASAFAQAPSGNAPPPPQMERLEEGEQPAITIPGKPSRETEITETRKQGQVTEVKVKRGNNEYYLHPNTPRGSALPGDVQSNQTRAAEWRIGEFEAGGKKPDTRERPEPEQTLQPNPAAAAPAPPAAPQGGSK